MTSLIEIDFHESSLMTKPSAELPFIQGLETWFGPQFDSFSSQSRKPALCPSVLPNKTDAIVRSVENHPGFDCGPGPGRDLISLRAQSRKQLFIRSIHR
jgi:hypothetical protein